MYFQHTQVNLVDRRPRSLPALHILLSKENRYDDDDDDDYHLDEDEEDYGDGGSVKQSQKYDGGITLKILHPPVPFVTVIIIIITSIFTFITIKGEFISERAKKRRWRHRHKLGYQRPRYSRKD